jgi:lysophospholipid acyltransferase (LPLAT)-like uncharacterized protein
MTRLLWRIAEWPVALAWVIYYRIIRATSRIEDDGGANSGPAIYVNWHRHQSFLVAHHGLHRRWMMVSPAPPLIPIVRLCRLIGLRVALGASGDHGAQAREILRTALTQGDSVAIAVDGPAGPAFSAKRGCADLALDTGAPIIAIAYHCSRGLEFRRRWDQQLLPLPLSRIRIVHSSPIPIEGSADDILQRVEAALNALLVTSSAPSS